MSKLLTGNLLHSLLVTPHGLWTGAQLPLQVLCPWLYPGLPCKKRNSKHCPVVFTASWGEAAKRLSSLHCLRTKAAPRDLSWKGAARRPDRDTTSEMDYHLGQSSAYTEDVLDSPSLFCWTLNFQENCPLGHEHSDNQIMLNELAACPPPNCLLGLTLGNYQKGQFLTNAFSLCLVQVTYFMETLQIWYQC